MKQSSLPTKGDFVPSRRLPIVTIVKAIEPCSRRKALSDVSTFNVEKRHWRVVLMLNLLLQFTLMAVADARSWNVQLDGRGDAPTIQAAIDSASTGDSVRVLSGVYFENLDMSGKGISLIGSHGAASTIVDGGRQGRVLTMTDGVVQGFTLRNGLSDQGAGILVAALTTTAVLIRDNTIEGNVASVGFENGFGGGILFLPATGVTIESNVIRNNFAEFAGGGIFDFGGAGIPRNVIQDNLISNNVSKFGGGIRLFACLVIGNTIASCEAEFSGGAIYQDIDGDSQVQGNSVVGNMTHNGFENGAGIDIFGSAILRNNLIAHNSGPLGQSSGAGLMCRNSGTVTVECNLFWGNDNDTSNCSTGAGNLFETPEFCAIDPVTSGNFMLQSDSPCLPENHPGGASCGLIGAWSVGCDTVSVAQRTWSEMKRLYR